MSSAAVAVDAQAAAFKARIIELPPGGAMPECRMSSRVIFVVPKGTVRVRVNAEETALQEKQCLITEPATLSLHSDAGARLLRIQIAAT